MRKYFINNKEVTKAEWQDAFHQYTRAHVVLKVPHPIKPFQPPETRDVIAPEKAKEIRLKDKLKTK